MPDIKTVFIVDDDAGFRDSLVWLLESAGYHCRDFDSAEAFIGDYDNEPGCLLLDIRMPGLSGLELQKTLNNRGVVLPVILITGHGSIAWAVEGMKNQAVDFIEKPFNDEALLVLVEKTLKLAEGRFTRSRNRDSLLEKWQQLSRRERQVADLVAEGFTNKDIAEQLGVSIKTIEVHRSRFMKKLSCENIAHFINAYAQLKVTINL